MNRETVGSMKVLRAGRTLCWFCFCCESAGTEGADVACDLGNDFFINNFSDSFI